jgi:hypothetical protein
MAPCAASKAHTIHQRCQYFDPGWMRRLLTDWHLHKET